jgi:hypothetical protein
MVWMGDGHNGEGNGTMTTTATPTVTQCLDAEWAMDAALNTLNAGRTLKTFASDFAAYAEAVRVNVALGKLVVAEGLQAEYRQARIDRINAFTRVVA